MALFSIFKKDKQPALPQPETTLLGMVLLAEPRSLQLAAVLEELKGQLPVTDSSVDESTLVLTVRGQQIAIGLIPAPIPGNEVVEAAAYNIFWNNDQADVSTHQGHVLVTVIGAGKGAVKSNMLFTRVIAAVLNHSHSLGVYIGGRTLVLRKDFYLGNAAEMAEDDLPLYNWIYFGPRKEATGGQSVYTYGLKEFGKLEMEIIGSSHSFEELMDTMYNLTHYVLASDVVLKHGETIGATADEKLRITVSKGVYVDGNTLKISY